VNNVAPGFIDTDLTQELEASHRDQIIRRSALRRMADIQDIANAVDFLFTDKACNITGTTITVDAGNTA
jgi:3-oxoacyl-[acyl-carrier protein] reductase